MLLLPSHTAAGCDAGLLMVSAKHLAGLIPAAYICSSCCKLCCDRRSGCPATLTSSITDAATSRLLASCLLHFDCCQGDDVLATLTLLLSPTLCVALGVLCLGAQMAVQHLIAFLSGVLQGLYLGRVSHTTAAVLGMVSRFLHCAAVQWCCCALGVTVPRQVLQASRMLQTRLCFVRMLCLLLLATGALPCAKQGFCRGAYIGFAAESGPASSQSAGSLISSQEHCAELNTSGNLKPQGWVPS